MVPTEVAMSTFIARGGAGGGLGGLGEVELGGGDKAVIAHWVGNFHVGTPDAEVADKARRKYARGAKGRPELLEAAVAYAVKVHQQNRQMYRDVMGGGFGAVGSGREYWDIPGVAGAKLSLVQGRWGMWTVEIYIDGSEKWSGFASSGRSGEGPATHEEAQSYARELLSSGKARAKAEQIIQHMHHTARGTMPFGPPGTRGGEFGAGGEHFTLTPAYGRDYKSKAEVEADFLANKDFLNQSYGEPRPRPINREQIPPGSTVNVRYARMTKVAVLKR
jgi:hypothetical protein